MVPLRRAWIVFFIGWIGVSFAGCATLEIGLVKPPTPDQQVLGTLTNLMLKGTHMAIQMTAQARTSTPTPSMGSVSGKICYPGDRSPAMSIYFRNIQTNQLTEFQITAGHSSYSVSLPPGDYYANAWAPDYQVGGLYSEAVRCGLGNACTDHSPIPFKVIAGTFLDDVDICDWILPSEFFQITSTPQAFP
jgi:hypothetical protein